MAVTCRSETIRQKHFGLLERLLWLIELTTSDWDGDRQESAQLGLSSTLTMGHFGPTACVCFVIYYTRHTFPQSRQID
jgi:hypothetical protein